MPDPQPEKNDPFRFIDQEERSLSHIEELAPVLAKRARELRLLEADIDLVGCVFETGCSEFRIALEQLKLRLHHPSPQGFIEVLPRHIAFAILRLNMPPSMFSALENIPHTDFLPIVIATKSGFRLGGHPIPPPWAPFD